ncbi:hypothetical protein APHAL10511_007101 [Amanita phalloides]|nr:hypothetical protein APHAL10511_007101 [Amanita phalloides]
MPPKRKRAEKAAETATPSTRAISSARAAAEQDVTSNVTPESERISKKSKKASTENSGTKGRGKKQKSGQDEMSKVSSLMTLQPRAFNNDTNTDRVTKYDPKRSLDLFTAYAQIDDPTLVGPEGFEKLCDDAQIPMDGAMPLILSWQVGAQEMAKLTVQAWTTGMDTLKVSSLLQLNNAVRDLNDLLILGHPPLTRPASKSNKETKEPYDRTKFWEYAENPDSAFRDFYLYNFSLAKPPPSRNIDIETAIALWSVLLVPRFPLMGEVLAFITDKGTYKAANKDLWTMMLEFCRTVSTDLEGYDPDAAWPTLLDDFVAWKKGITTT